jgi:hypothetical protein
MAYLLGRSYAAVQNRRNRTTLQSWNAERRDIPTPRRHARWTPAEDATVVRDDITLTQMCHLLGRSTAKSLLSQGCNTC